VGNKYSRSAYIPNLSFDADFKTDTGKFIAFDSQAIYDSNFHFLYAQQNLY